jgi:hypothetical protein
MQIFHSRHKRAVALPAKTVFEICKVFARRSNVVEISARDYANLDAAKLWLCIEINVKIAVRLQREKEEEEEEIKNKKKSFTLSRTGLAVTAVRKTVPSDLTEILLWSIIRSSLVWRVSQRCKSGVNTSFPI